MKLLTKNTDYAIRALLVMASCRDRFVSARAIAKAQGMPYQYLRRILQSLIKEGLAVSKEGGGGGFKLKVRPDKIRIADLIRIFQGRIQLSECMFRKRYCRNRSNCVLRKNLQRIERMVTDEFERLTIGGLSKELEKSGGRSL